MFQKRGPGRPKGSLNKNKKQKPDVQEEEQPLVHIGQTTVEIRTQQDIRRTLQSAHPKRAKASWVAAKTYALQLADDSLHDFDLCLKSERAFMCQKNKISPVQFLPKDILRAILQEGLTTKWVCLSPWWQLDVDNNLGRALQKLAKEYNMPVPRLDMLIGNKKEWREGLADALVNKRLTRTAALKKAKEMTNIALTGCFKMLYDDNTPGELQFSEQLDFSQENFGYWGLVPEHPMTKNLAGLAAECRKVANHNPSGLPHNYDKRELAQRLAAIGFRQEVLLLKTWLEIRQGLDDADGAPMEGMHFLSKFDAIVVRCESQKNAQHIADLIKDRLPWIELSVESMAWTHDELCRFYSSEWSRNYAKIEQLNDRAMSFLMDYMADNRLARIGEGLNAAWLKLDVQDGFAYPVDMDTQELRYNMINHSCYIANLNPLKRLLTYGGTVTSPWFSIQQVLSQPLVYGDKTGKKIFGCEISRPEQPETQAKLPMCFKRFDCNFDELAEDLWLSPEATAEDVEGRVMHYVKKNCPAFYKSMIKAQDWTLETVVCLMALLYPLFTGKAARCMPRWLNLKGVTNTGKSTFVEFLSKIIAVPDAVEDINKASQETFALGSMDRRVAYCVKELSGSSKAGVGTFLERSPALIKTLTGDDKMSTVRKNQDQRTVQCDSYLITCGNLYPSDGDAFSPSDLGPFLRRYASLEFPNHVQVDPNFSSRLDREAGPFFFLSYVCFCYFVSGRYVFGLGENSQSQTVGFKWEKFQSDQMKKWRDNYREYLSPLAQYLRTHAVYQQGARTRLSDFVGALNFDRRQRKLPAVHFSEADMVEALIGQDYDLINATECKACDKHWFEDQEPCGDDSKNHREIKFLKEWKLNTKHCNATFEHWQ
jgi:hypothetical protein